MILLLQIPECWEYKIADLGHQVSVGDLASIFHILSTPTSVLTSVDCWK